MVAAYRCGDDCTSRGRSSLALAAVIFILALLTTSCFDLDMDVAVREDGSGSVSMMTRVDEAALDALVWLEEVAAEDTCRQFLTDRDGVGLSAVMYMASFVSFGPGTVSVDTEGDCVVTTTAAWTAEESDTTLAALSDHDQFRLRRLDNGGWRFEMEMGQFKDEELALDDLQPATSLLSKSPTMAISVTLPGDVVAHNADSVFQSSYSWAFDLVAADDLPETLYVETAPGGGLGSAAVGGVVAAAVLALAALMTLLRHRKGKVAEPDDAGSDAAHRDDGEFASPAEDSDSGHAVDDR